MNTETLDKLRRMKLPGMYRTFKTSIESGKPETMTADELIGQLVDAKRDEWQNRSIELRVRNARFRYEAALEDVRYRSDRKIEKNQVLRYADCGFIDRAETILITGSTGIGKSYLASALGHNACSKGYRVA